ncbi:MAG TPA: hypothetical protein VNO81_05815 [Candidatus Nitrosotenuis sp.]|nr:hypothetical protein [Candidatus Nitrosotenuis sp.]
MSRIQPPGPFPVPARARPEARTSGGGPDPLPVDRADLGQAPAPVSAVPLYVRRPEEVAVHPSVANPAASGGVPVILWVQPESQPLPADIDEPPTPTQVMALVGAPGMVCRAGEGLYGTLNMVLSADLPSIARLDDLTRAIRTVPDESVQVATALCGSGARPLISRFPGDIDYNEVLVIRADHPDEADRILARKIVESIRRAQRQGLILAAIQVGEIKYLPGPGGIFRRRGWNGSPTRVAEGPGGTLAADLAGALRGKDHEFLKVDFIAQVEGGYRDVTKNLRYVVEDTQGRRRLRSPGPPSAYEEIYRSEAEALLAAQVNSLGRPLGLADPAGIAEYRGMLRRQAIHYAEEGHWLKAANRLYTLYASQGDWERANAVGPLLSAAPALGHQVASEMGTLARALKRDLPLDLGVVRDQARGFLDRLADASPSLAYRLREDLDELAQSLSRGDRRQAVEKLEALRGVLANWADHQARSYLFGRPALLADLQRP